MNKAKLIKADLPTFTGNAALYELDPPLKGYDERTEHKYVVASAATVMFSGPETYLFPANKAGKVTDWCELPGSMRGTLSHEDALSEAGYEIV